MPYNPLSVVSYTMHQIPDSPHVLSMTVNGVKTHLELSDYQKTNHLIKATLICGNQIRLVCTGLAMWSFLEMPPGISLEELDEIQFE